MRGMLGVVLSFALTLSACKSNKAFRDVQFEKDNPPHIEYGSVLDLDIGSLTKFIVVRLAGLKEAGRESVDPIDEEHLLFLARSHLELLGYRYTTDVAQADFIVSVSFSSEQKEHYIPPKTVWLPRYTPGQSATVNYYGFSGSTSYSGSATVSTPGSFSLESHTRPGYSVFDFQPILYYVASNQSGKVLFYAGALGRSKVSNIRSTAPWLIDKVANKIPPCSEKNSPSDPRPLLSKYGVRLAPATIDGNEYYPTVMADPLGDSIAESAGLYKYDVILEINGQSTRNKSIPGILSLLQETSESQTQLLVKRPKRTHQITLTTKAPEDQ